MLVSDKYKFDNMNVCPLGASRTALGLASRNFVDKCSEILGSAPGSADLLDIYTKDGYLVVCVADKGLSDEDVERLKSLYKKGVNNSGHSEHGIGRKANSWDLSISFIELMRDNYLAKDASQKNNTDYKNIYSKLVMKQNDDILTQHYILDGEKGIVYRVNGTSKLQTHSNMNKSDIDNMYSKYKSKFTETRQTISLIPFIPEVPNDGLFGRESVFNALKKDLLIRWSEHIFNKSVKIYLEDNILSLKKPLYNKQLNVEVYKGIDKQRPGGVPLLMVKIDGHLTKHMEYIKDSPINFMSEAYIEENIRLKEQEAIFRFKYDSEFNLSERREEIEQEYKISQSEQHGIRVSKQNTHLSSNTITSTGLGICRKVGISKNNHISACIDVTPIEDDANKSCYSDVIKTSPDKSGRCSINKTCVKKAVRLVVEGYIMNNYKKEEENNKVYSETYMNTNVKEITCDKSQTPVILPSNTNVDDLLKPSIINSFESTPGYTTNLNLSDTKSESSLDLEEANESFSGSSDADSEPDEMLKDFSKKVKRDALVNQKHMCKDITTGECGIEKSIVTKYAPEYRCNYSDVKFPIIGEAYLCEYDHKIPKCDGGNRTLENCQALCPCCHAVKTKIEGFLREKK